MVFYEFYGLLVKTANVSSTVFAVYSRWFQSKLIFYRTFVVLFFIAMISETTNGFEPERKKDLRDERVYRCFKNSLFF